MHKFLIISFGVVASVVVLYGLFGGSEPASNIEPNSEAHKEILASTGEKLGVNLRSPFFEQQTKCHTDPFLHYENPEVKFRSICYRGGEVITDLYWVRKDLSLANFVEQNVEVIARDRAERGFINTDKKSIQFLEERNGVSYHFIKIGDNFSAVQATLFVESENSLGVNLAVMVKAVDFESAVQKIEEIKAQGLTDIVEEKATLEFNLIQKAHAQDGDGSEGGDGDGGGDGGGSSESPGGDNVGNGDGTYTSSVCTYLSTCEPGPNGQCTTTWVCPSSASPSGALTIVGCAIAAYQNTCAMTIKGSVVNGIAPYVYINENPGWNWGTEGAAIDHSGWWGLPIGPQSVSFTLADNNGILSSGVAVNTCANGTTWAGTYCAPVPTLSFYASPNIIDPTESAILTWSVSGATSCVAGGGWSGGRAATDGLHTERVTPESTTSYTLTCTGPGGTVGPISTSVTVNPPIVNFTANPNHIGPGSTSRLSWSTIGATTCTGSGGTGWAGNKNVPSGYEDKEPTITTTYHLSCSGPSGVTNKSATIILPSGSINATSCEVSASAGSCTSYVSWNSANLLGTPSVLQQGTEFSRAASGTSEPRSVTPVRNTFTLRDTGSSFVREAIADVNCHISSIWVDPLSLCVLKPLVDMTAESPLIRSGERAHLTIDITANYDLTCLVTGGISQTINHAPSASPVMYELDTNPLTAAQFVTVTCVSPQYDVLTASDEVRVNVIPTIQEI